MAGESGKSVEEMKPIQPAPQVQPHEWAKLTPGQIVKLAGQWSVRSWLFLASLVSAIFLTGWGLGYAYKAGLFPDIVYAGADSAETPRETRLKLDNEARFKGAFGELMDWEKLQAISANIAEENPDGLDTEFEIAAALIAQVKATNGEAHFLSGRKQISVKLIPIENGFNLDWSEQKSIIPRIANDAGYRLSKDELRLMNSNLNWAGFGYFDDSMRHAVVYRGLDGNLNLTISK